MVLPALIPLALGIASEFAPSLIRRLAGDDAGDVAAQVVGAVKAATGKDDASEALEMVRADPALAANLRTRLAEIELETEKAYLADRQNARARDVAMVRAGRHNWRADIMLAMAFGSLVAVIWMTWSGRLDMPDGVFAFLNMAAGALLKMIGDAFAFEFGSSRGSKEKDEMLRR
jgi:hypothetical protein